MPSRIRRRNLLAGLAFANRLRIPSPTGGVLRTGIRTFTLTAAAGSAAFLPKLSTPTWALPRQTVFIGGAHFTAERPAQSSWSLMSYLPGTETLLGAVVAPVRYIRTRRQPPAALTASSAPEPRHPRPRQHRRNPRP